MKEEEKLMSKTNEQFLRRVLFRFSKPPLNFQEFAMPQNLLVASKTSEAGRCSLMSFTLIKWGLLQNWRVQLLWKSSNPLIYIYSIRNSVYTGSQQPVATLYQAQPSKTSVELDSQTSRINILSSRENKRKTWLLFAGHKCAQTPSGFPALDKTDLRILFTSYVQQCLSKETPVQISYKRVTTWSSYRFISRT